MYLELQYKHKLDKSNGDRLTTLRTNHSRLTGLAYRLALKFLPVYFLQFAFLTLSQNCDNNYWLRQVCRSLSIFLSLHRPSVCRSAWHNQAPLGGSIFEYLTISPKFVDKFKVQLKSDHNNGCQT